MKRWKFIPLLIVAAGLLAYQNSFTGEFVFDDHVWIENNPRVRQGSLLKTASGTLRPVVQLSLALNYAVGGLDVRSYHVFNLGVHVLAGLTLYGIVRRTLAGSQLFIWNDTVAKRPQDARAHYNLGLALEQGGRIEEAIDHWEKALRINPSFDDAHYNLGSVLSQMGKSEEAVMHFNQALRIRPNRADVHNNLAAALFRLGRVQEAVDHFHRALQIEPNNPRLHTNLGNLLLSVGNTQEAISQYNQALRVKPDYAEAQSNLRSALLHEGIPMQSPSSGK